MTWVFARINFVGIVTITPPAAMAFREELARGHFEGIFAAAKESRRR